MEHVSQNSITIYQTGSIAGGKGLIVFLLAGKKEKKRAANDKLFFRKTGMAEASFLVMTCTALMTTEAWKKITTTVIKNLKAINAIVAANSQ